MLWAVFSSQCTGKTDIRDWPVRGIKMWERDPRGLEGLEPQARSDPLTNKTMDKRDQTESLEMNKTST